VVEPTNNAAAPDLGPDTINGILGWESVEAHTDWVKSPKAASASSQMHELGQAAGMKPVTVYGRDMFHVTFYPH
jgi:heme-degrading monooxygenase HmoA